MKLIEEMERYAGEHRVPIMEAEGIAFLLDLIQTKGCKRILEIGTAIGYSAIRMALCDEDIYVETIERDEERYRQAVENVAKAGLQDRVTLHFADALAFEANGCYDLIFIDAAKAQYIRFFERYTPYLKSGGIVVSDNLRFHGMVDGSVAAQSRGTRALVRKLRRYIEYLQENEDFNTVFYDLGDGVAVSEKR